MFSENGNVLGAKVVYNRKDGVPRAFGFVSLASQSEVEAAIASLHGKEFHGRILVVRQVRATNKEFYERILVVKDAKVKSQV